MTVNDTVNTNFVTLDNVGGVREPDVRLCTAHLNYASLTPFTVTPEQRRRTITSAPGQSTASSGPQPAQGDDVYLDGGATQVSIAGTSGGNFEAVNYTTYGNATVTIKDTIDDRRR